MTKVFLALGAAAVALSAAPAEAKHYTNLTKCVRYHHGRCVAWKRLTRGEARRRRVSKGPIRAKDKRAISRAGHQDRAQYAF